MITLKIGDRLPTVAVLQSFLNQRRASEGFITVDGIFGSQTRKAVEDFKRSQGMPVSGVVSDTDWNTIVGKKWQVIESVDLTDFDDPKWAATDDQDLKPYGQTLLLHYGQCNGVGDVIRTIESSARTGTVALLRFHGHGGPGNMVVSSGRRGNRASSMNVRYGPPFFAFASRLKHIFAPFGSAEMHGCRVALGQQGHSLLSGLAGAWGVPVTASTVTQYGGSGDDTYRFEGPIVTICPDGMSLQDWARSKCQQSLVPA